MYNVYGEIEQIEKNGAKVWRAGIVIEKNGLWTCPGLDFYFQTRDEAIQDSTRSAEDYVGECIDQEYDAEFCGIREIE